MSELPPVRPGMVVGILGGGQLGRMLALAAAELGLSCHIYCPDPKSPAFAVAAARTADGLRKAAQIQADADRDGREVVANAQEQAAKVQASATCAARRRREADMERILVLQAALPGGIGNGQP